MAASPAYALGSEFSIHSVQSQAAASGVPLASSVASGEIAAAEQGLALGQGPAGGHPSSCSGTASGLAAVCTTHLSASSASTVHTDHWTSSTNPGPRAYGAMVYDVQDRYVVMFGGTNGSGFLNDTWEYLHGRWVQLDPTLSPPARSLAGFAYDKTDNEAILFGGLDGSGPLGDTWSFSGGIWSQLEPTLSPSPRSDPAMAWDAHDGVVLLFGGNDGSGTLADTWEFVHGTWSPVTKGPPPPGREGAALTFDYADQYTVLFGGENVTNLGRTALADTWSFANGRWQSVPASPAPSPRYQSVISYDFRDTAVVLFGGTDPVALRQYQDTWEFAGGAWAKVSTSAAPSPRGGAAGVWTQADNYLLVFSGNEGGLPATVPDTWGFVYGAWHPEFSTPKFSWPEPSARYGGSIAFEPQDNYSVMFGGETYYHASNETWGFVNQQWTQFLLDPSPPARYFSNLVYDPVDQYLVLFGGLNDSSVALNDTWVYQGGGANLSVKPLDMTAGYWTQLSPLVSPPARYGAQMTYDQVDHEILLFGGINATGAPLNDTWAFAGGQWTELSAGGGGSSPPARAFGSMLNDTRDGYVLLFGGLSGSTVLGDTWEFAGGTWTNISRASYPEPRWGAMAIYEPINNIVVLFGGCEQAVNPAQMQCDQLANDTWRFIAGQWAQILRDPSPPPLAESMFTFDPTKNDHFVLIDSGLTGAQGALSSDRWAYNGIYTQWFPAAYPGGRAGAAAIYDERDQHIVMFGGFTVGSGGKASYLNDTWEWDTFVWDEAHPARSPSARAFMALAYDPVDKYVVLFGGLNSSGILGDTWKWVGSSTSGDWTRLNPAVSPPARSNATMTWDAKDGYLLMFGGEGATGPLNDTWTFLGGSWTQVHPTLSPSARESASGAFDSTDGYVVLFGGANATGAFLGDTWRYAGGSWSLVSATGGPSPRIGAMISDNPLSSDVVVFGGEGPSGTFLNDTWTFAGGTWTQILVGVVPTPVASAFSAVGNDVDDGNVEMFGGYNGGTLAGFWTLL